MCKNTIAILGKRVSVNIYTVPNLMQLCDRLTLINTGRTSANNNDTQRRINATTYSVCRATYRHHVNPSVELPDLLVVRTVVVITDKFRKFDALSIVLRVGALAREMGVELGGEHLYASLG